MKLSPSGIVHTLALICFIFNWVDSYKLDKPKTAFVHSHESPPLKPTRNVGKSALIHVRNKTSFPPSTTDTPESVKERTTSSRTTTDPADDSSQTTTSKAVFDQDTTTSPKDCNPKEHYYPQTGTCYALASRGPCESDRWYIKNKKTDQASCQKRYCPPFYTQYKERCILLTDAEQEGVCERGEQLYIDEYGDSSCDCRPLHYRWPKDKFCYPSYYRGPCQQDQYIVFNDQTKEVECATNECLEDEFIKINGECKQLGDVCGEYGEKNIYINPHTGKAGCYDFFRPGTEEQ